MSVAYAVKDLATEHRAASERIAEALERLARALEHIARIDPPRGAQ